MADSITMAHIADVITHIHDVDGDYPEMDYDAIADDAASLLRHKPELAQSVAQWNAGEITWDALVAAVRAALTAPATRYAVYTHEDGRGREVDAGTDARAAWELADRMRANGQASATVLAYEGGVPVRFR